MANEQSLPGPFGADVAVTHILVVTDPDGHLVEISQAKASSGGS
jgi:hypothetical protein